MSFFFEDFFRGFPGAHEHGPEDEEESGPVDTNKFYELLGVAKDADENEIKNAYKKKARELHPDRHPDEREQYQHLFQELQFAYDALKDPEKRKIYDRYGEKGVRQATSASGYGKKGDDSGLKKSPLIKQILEVTLEDLYKGTMREVQIEKHMAGSNTKKCDRCHGDGVITTIQRMGPMMFQQRRECPKCEGQGYELESKMVTVQVHIPVGAKTGEQVTVRGEGHCYPEHAPGDVTFQLRTIKHEVFSRQGADLGMTTTLTLKEALCGYELKIPHLSGHILLITPPKNESQIVQPGSLKRITGYGMPQRYAAHVKGHLYIVMEVKMPLIRTLSNQTIQELKKILPDQHIVQSEESKDDSEEMKSNTNSNAKPKEAKTPKSDKKNDKKNKGNKKKGDKSKKKKTQDEDEDEEIVEEVTCDEVSGKPQPTPAAARGIHDEDEEENEGVPCQQM